MLAEVNIAAKSVRRKRLLIVRSLRRGIACSCLHRRSGTRVYHQDWDDVTEPESDAAKKVIKLSL
jgi:hypothetical protein